MTTFQCPRGHYQKVEASLFTDTCGGRRCNTHKLEKETFELNMRKHCPVRMVQHWNRLPGVAAQTPSLEVFKKFWCRKLAESSPEALGLISQSSQFWEEGWVRGPWRFLPTWIFWFHAPVISIKNNSIISTFYHLEFCYLGSFGLQESARSWWLFISTNQIKLIISYFVHTATQFENYVFI